MIVAIDDVTFYYEEYGAGIPVICLHGFYVDSNLMKGCLEPTFTTCNAYKRIYIDLIGMGKTPATKTITTSDSLFNLLIQFIDKVTHTQPFVLIGESYGGYLSLGLLQHYQSQIIGLFLIAPCVMGDHSTRTLPEAQCVLKESIIVAKQNDDTFHDFLNMAVVVTENTWQRYYEEVLPGINNANSAYLNAITTEEYILSSEKDFHKIQFHNPTTVLLGKQDHVVGYEDAMTLKTSFSRGTFAIIDSAGHNLQIESPHLFQSFLQDFLLRLQNESI